MFWKLVGRSDIRACWLADRHYSRQKPGSPQFCPPGNSLVLIALNDDALWVSHRPDPKAGLARPRFDGFEYWDNPFFRNESSTRASDMIREALAITLFFWHEIPRDGFHSFVDPRYVKPVMQHGQPVYGWCFQKAGFVLHPKRTLENKLYRWIFSAEQLRQMKPIEPFLWKPYEQQALQITV